jgi:hypothetical protein
MTRCHPRVSKVVVSYGKVCKGPLHPRKEISKILVEWEKRLKETQPGVGLDEKHKIPQWRCRY